MRFIIWLSLGLLIGPSVLGLPRVAALTTLGEIAGGIFLLFAGWELKFLASRRESPYYTTIFLGSFVVPVLVAYWFFDGHRFLALAIGISALPVAIQILKEKGIFRTPLGREVVTVASLCDVIAWVAMAFLFSNDSIVKWLTSHWIVGMFFVGLLLGRFWPEPEKISKFQAKWISPIFFINLGWGAKVVSSFDWRIVTSVFLVALFSKTIGTMLAAKASGRSWDHSWNLAILLNARGAMEILAAKFALSSNLIDEKVFTALILTAVLTSAMAVPLARSSKSNR